MNGTLFLCSCRPGPPCLLPRMRMALQCTFMCLFSISLGFCGLRCGFTEVLSLLSDLLRKFQVFYLLITLSSLMLNYFLWGNRIVWGFQEIKLNFKSLFHITINIWKLVIPLGLLLA